MFMQLKTEFEKICAKFIFSSIIILKYFNTALSVTERKKVNQ